MLENRFFLYCTYYNYYTVLLISPFPKKNPKVRIFYSDLNFLNINDLKKIIEL